MWDIWAHSHVWGAPLRQSSSACRLESIDPVTFLDRGGRACHSKSDRDAGSICACRPSPDWGSRVKNLATNFWLSRGQHPANVDGHYAGGTEAQPWNALGARPGGSVSRLLPCLRCPFRIRSRTARVGWKSSDRQRGEALPRPRCWRPARRTQPQRGHLCGWSEHNYC